MNKGQGKTRFQTGTLARVFWTQRVGSSVDSIFTFVVVNTRQVLFINANPVKAKCQTVPPFVHRGANTAFKKILIGLHHYYQIITNIKGVISKKIQIKITTIACIGNERYIHTCL